MGQDYRGAPTPAMARQDIDRTNMATAFALNDSAHRPAAKERGEVLGTVDCSNKHRNLRCY